MSMKKLPAGIEENLHFLCVEVDSQLITMQHYFQQASPALARRLLDRAGYAENLKSRILSVTANKLVKGVKQNSDKVIFRCIEFIANDLERVTDICRKCIQLSERITEENVLIKKPLISMLGKTRQAIELVMPAIMQRKADIAIEIGHINARMRVTHQNLLTQYIDALKYQENTEQLSQALFVSYELKQLDDCLQSICESIISANLGQVINLERYFSLQSLFNAVDDSDELSITPIAETRSGSAISGVSSSNEAGYMAIYKDGQKQKLKEERQGLNSWHDIYPGLAPKILSYQKKGGSASLLIEHLPGYTFEHIVINENQALINLAFKQLRKTLNSVWLETKYKTVHPANYMQQLQKRLPDVYKIHPEFKRQKAKIGDLQLTSFDDLIKQAKQKEAQWNAPFSVYIHGDFNVDNIIFDPIDQRINFIDLHRSRYTDYVQDVSIFMVSNYRLQILEIKRRKMIMAVAVNMYKAAKRFAKKQGDDTFELRLALGLARAFATSTRFILDKSLAKRMFMRAVYLIELIAVIDEKKLSQFKVPVKEMFVD